MIFPAKTLECTYRVAQKMTFRILLEPRCSRCTHSIIISRHPSQPDLDKPVSGTGLRISNVENLASRVLRRFHSLQQYRVSNLQYRVSPIFFSNGFRDFFCLFSPKKSFLRSKTHIFGSLGIPDFLPPLI